MSNHLLPIIIGVFALAIALFAVAIGIHFRDELRAHRARLSKLDLGALSGGASGIDPPAIPWARIRSTAISLTITGGIVSFVVAFVGMFFAPSPWGTISTVWLAFGVGLLAIPGIIYAFKGYSSLLAPILYTVAALTQGVGNGRGWALDRRATGHYELNPIEKRDGVWRLRRDDEWIDIDDASYEHVSRLGLVPFAITWEKDEMAIRRLLATVDSDDTEGMVLSDGGVTDERPAGDAEIKHYLLDRERGGSKLVAGRDVVENTADGYPIRMEIVRDKLREAGGSELGWRTFRETLKEKGGEGDWHTLVFIGYVVLMAILGFAMAVFTGGMI